VFLSGKKTALSSSLFSSVVYKPETDYIPIPIAVQASYQKSSTQPIRHSIAVQEDMLQDSPMAAQF
jgi:hypothetical protein